MVELPEVVFCTPILYSDILYTFILFSVSFVVENTDVGPSISPTEPDCARNKADCPVVKLDTLISL